MNEGVSWTGNEVPKDKDEPLIAYKWQVKSKNPCSQCAERDGKLFISAPQQHTYCGCEIIHVELKVEFEKREVYSRETEDVKEYAGFVDKGHTRTFNLPNGDSDTVTNPGPSERLEVYFVFRVETTTFIDTYAVWATVEGKLPNPWPTYPAKHVTTFIGAEHD